MIKLKKLDLKPVSLDEGIKELKKFYNYLIPDVSIETYEEYNTYWYQPVLQKSFEYYIKDKKYCFILFER